MEPLEVKKELEIEEDEREEILERLAQNEETKKLMNEQLIREISQKSERSERDEGEANGSFHQSPSFSEFRTPSPTSIPVPVFQRVYFTTEEEDLPEGETCEETTVCVQIQKLRKLRARYHIDFHKAPYYGPFDAEKYKRAQSEAERLHRQQWGPKFRGRAAAVFEAAFPDKVSKILKPMVTISDSELSCYSFRLENGVYKSYFEETQLDPSLPSVDDFFRDLEDINRFHNFPAAKTMCFKRLELLSARFNLHKIMNSQREAKAQRAVSHRDFYNVRKVDGHIHHTAIMTQKHLLRFIKQKIKRCSDEIVTERNGRYLTLREVFDSLGLTAYDLSIDHLDMHADNTFHRFDRFNLKYNPVGETRLREVFLKTSNLISGRYLAEITHQVFRDLEENKYVLVEPRVSIYGRSHSEWIDLGKWYSDNHLASPNVRWMIQIPRLYSAYKSSGLISCFQDLLDNIFVPLFEATIHPERHVEIDCFLNVCVGMDCVDDESKMDETHPTGSWPKPSNWKENFDPPYSYWIYYIYANLRELNTLRKRMGKTTFSLRPHAGETGDLSHLSATFLCSESINHGIMLRKSPVLQYLYYLEQIGLAISPLSNNKLFVEYEANPFPIFFARGLNVALSTDDPLLLHMTKDPLVEEYSVAAQVWKLSSTDMCEIARNSVLMSGLEHPFKSHYIGEHYYESGVRSNNIETTNVPDVRVQYRFETLFAEQRFVQTMADQDFQRV